MQVTVLSRKTIEPSSSNLQRLESFKLLCFPKMSSLVYTPLFLFFPKSNNDDSEEFHETISTLESSLSETLNRFLFLEGEFVGDSINCDYAEVIFVQTRVTGRMLEIFEGPNKDVVLMKLVMYSTLRNDQGEKYAQIGVQINIFECGSVVVSLCLLHEVMDPTTLSCFLQSWFDINRSSFKSLPRMACSDFGPLSSLFYPRQKQFLFSSSNSQPKGCFNKLVFKRNAIPSLKAEAKSSDDVQNPTCVAVLLGAVWKSVLEFVRLQQRRTNSHSPSVLSHAIISLHSSLPRFSMGNFWWIEVAQYLANGTVEIELSKLVKFLRESFQEINGDYYWKKSLVENEENRVASKLLSAEVIPKLYICTNWENIALDEADFGWENTIRIDSNTRSKNIDILLRAIKDDEIEVWMVLEEAEEIELLVNSEKFRSFVDLTFP